MATKNHKNLNSHTCHYSNGAKFSVTYYPEPDPLYPYEDRIELIFYTESKDKVGVRMTFSEALQVSEYLVTVANRFLEEATTKKDFDIPFTAK